MECKEPTLLQKAPEERIRQLKEELKVERIKLLVAAIIDALKTYNPDSFCGIPHVKIDPKDISEKEFDAFIELLHNDERLTDEVVYDRYKDRTDKKQCILRLSKGIILELIYTKRASRELCYDDYGNRVVDDYGNRVVINKGYKDFSNYTIRLAEESGKRYFRIYNGRYDLLDSISDNSGLDFGNEKPLDEVLVPISCEELERRYCEICKKLDDSLKKDETDDVQNSSERQGITYVKLYEQTSFLGDIGSNL